MNKKASKYLFWGAIIILIVWVITDTISQPGVKDLNGNFKEVAVYRNENNTGPVIRVYAVTVEDTLWNEMEKYGNYMLYTKYGNTRVLFFLKDKPHPVRVYDGERNFDPSFNKYCIASYEKDNMGFVSFIKFPFDK